MSPNIILRNDVERLNSMAFVETRTKIVVMKSKMPWQPSLPKKPFFKNRKPQHAQGHKHDSEEGRI
jgi:hypothetical protein